MSRLMKRQTQPLMALIGLLLVQLLLEHFTALASIAAVVVAYYSYKTWSEKQKYRKSNIAEIDLMTGVEFEKKLAILFRDMGYKVRTTPTSMDFGADLILETKGGKIVVQAKRYNSKIDIQAVQEVIGSMAYYGAKGAMVVTNSYFTPQAKRLAKANKVELWDRDKLIEVLNCSSPSQKLEFALNKAD